MTDPVPPPDEGFNWARTRDILITLLILGIIVYGLALVLRHVLQTVIVFLLASLIAFAVLPLVDALERRRIPRVLSVVIVYLGLLLVLVFGGIAIGGRLAIQVTLLVTQVPTYTSMLEQALVQLQNYLQGHGFGINLNQQLGTVVSGFQSTFTGALGQSLHILTGITSALISIILVIFFSIYLVADAHRISRAVPLLLPQRYRRTVRFIEETISRKVGGFIRGQLIMALIIAITTGLVATLLQLRFSLIIGVVAFFFELIPSIGPVLIGIMLALVAVFQSFGQLVAVLVFYIVLNTIESNVLGPRVVGQAVGLPPFVSLIAIVAGAEVGGILGALFAVPVTALVVALIGAAIEEWREDAGWSDHSAVEEKEVSTPVSSPKH
ncbi:MAG: AI-2E family transporter [Chloroflexi bacterium]|nr:AI-2E family transporter [Chloroflexota bacterium]